MNVDPVCGSALIDPCVRELSEKYTGRTSHKCSIKCYCRTYAGVHSLVLEAAKELSLHQRELLCSHMERGTLPPKYLFLAKYASECISSGDASAISVRRYVLNRLEQCANEEEAFSLLCLVPNYTKRQLPLFKQSLSGSKQLLNGLKHGCVSKSVFIEGMRLAVMYKGKDFCRLTMLANSHLLTGSSTEKNIVSSFVSRAFVRRCAELNNVSVSICAKDFIELEDSKIAIDKAISVPAWRSELLTSTVGVKLVRNTFHVCSSRLKARSKVREPKNSECQRLIKEINSGLTDLVDLNKSLTILRRFVKSSTSTRYVEKYISARRKKGLTVDSVYLHLPHMLKSSSRIIKALSVEDHRLIECFKNLETAASELHEVIPVLSKYFGIRWIYNHLLRYERAMFVNDGESNLWKDFRLQFSGMMKVGRTDTSVVQVCDTCLQSHSDSDLCVGNVKDEGCGFDDVKDDNTEPVSSDDFYVESMNWMQSCFNNSSSINTKDEDLSSASSATDSGGTSLQHLLEEEALPGTSSATNSTVASLQHVLEGKYVPCTSSQLVDSYTEEFPIVFDIDMSSSPVSDGFTTIDWTDLDVFFSAIE